MKLSYENYLLVNVICECLCRSALDLSKYLLAKILKICQKDGVNVGTSKQTVNPVSSDWAGNVISVFPDVSTRNIHACNTTFSDFCAKASLLQSVSLQGLSKNGLIAFFLNVFHTILLHAFIVLGVPSSGLDWRSLKVAASYEIAGDLMSLKDIDETILGKCYCWL